MRLSLTMAGSLFQGEDEPDLDNAPASAVSFGTERTTRILSSPRGGTAGRSKAAPDEPHPWVVTTLTTPFRCSPKGQRSNSRPDHVRREEKGGGGGETGDVEVRTRHMTRANGQEGERLRRQQLALRVRTCMRVFQFRNAAPSVGLLSSPLSSPSEGRTRIPAQLPDSSPGRRSVRADK